MNHRNRSHVMSFSNIFEFKDARKWNANLNALIWGYTMFVANGAEFSLSDLSDFVFLAHEVKWHSALRFFKSQKAKKSEKKARKNRIKYSGIFRESDGALAYGSGGGGVRWPVVVWMFANAEFPTDFMG